jgi:hypothetical protein
MKSNKSNIISIRFDDELLASLKADAKQKYRPLAMHIRKILIDYMRAKNDKEKDKCIR